MQRRRFFAHAFPPQCIILVDNARYRCITVNNEVVTKQVGKHMRYMMFAIVLLAGCAQSQDRQTVTICDSAGCREQDRAASTFQPETTQKSEQLQALEAMAEENADAAFDLGMRLFRGEDGIPRNSYQALQWMRRAADRGDARAQLAVGQLYMSGLEEMGIDLREADKWLSLAAAQGNEEAAELLEEIRPALENQRLAGQYRERWRGRAYYYWYRAPIYYYYWDPAWYRYRYL